MQTFTVLYREPNQSPVDEPLGFVCQAEDGDHAEEQCTNAWPDCDVVWVVATDDVFEALDNFYTQE